MRRGLVVGKFMPLHRGHQLVIETALAHSDELTVVVYDTPVADEAAKLMPLAKRAGWITALYPQVTNIIARPDPAYRAGLDHSELDGPGYTQLYADDLAFLQPITHVFTSEEYGERFARALDAEHMRVDAARELMPISGTEFRSDIFRHRAFVDPLVYRSLIQKIVFVGTESTGKSTLAGQLAHDYGTLATTEYGRTLWMEHFEHGTEPSFRDFLDIGLTQHQQEEAAALHSNRYLFCDTNAWTTMLWSEMYYGSADARLRELAWETKDDYLWFLCANDFNWEQDGFRELLGERAATFQRRHVTALDEWKVPYVILYGDLEKRVEQVRGVLQRPRKRYSPLAA